MTPENDKPYREEKHKENRSIIQRERKFNSRHAIVSLAFGVKLDTSILNFCYEILDL